MNKDPMLLIQIIVIAGIILAGMSIVLTSLKTGIGPLPSSGEARKVVLSAADTAGKGPIIDLGSGWGSFVIPLARKYPDRKIIGYELSSVPYYFSLLLKRLLKTFSERNSPAHRCWCVTSFPGAWSHLRKSCFTSSRDIHAL
jgi:hypothetical protein